MRLPSMLGEKAFVRGLEKTINNSKKQNLLRNNFRKKQTRRIIYKQEFWTFSFAGRCFDMFRRCFALLSMKEIMIKHIPKYYYSLVHVFFSFCADQSSTFSWNAENADILVLSIDAIGKTRVHWFLSYAT